MSCATREGVRGCFTEDMANMWACDNLKGATTLPNLKWKRAEKVDWSQHKRWKAYSRKNSDRLAATCSFISPGHNSTGNFKLKYKGNSRDIIPESNESTQTLTTKWKLVWMAQLVVWSYYINTYKPLPQKGVTLYYVSKHRVWMLTMYLSCEGIHNI